VHPRFFLICRYLLCPILEDEKIEPIVKGFLIVTVRFRKYIHHEFNSGEYIEQTSIAFRSLFMYVVFLSYNIDV